MGQGARVAQAWVRPHDPGPGGCLQSQRTLPFQGWKDSSEPGELLLTATSPVPTIMLGAGLPGVRPRHSCPPTADGLCHSLPPPHPPHLVKASLALLTPRIAPPLPPVASEALRHRAPLSSLGWWPPSRHCSPGALPSGPASAHLPSLFPLPGMLSPFSHFSAEPASWSALVTAAPTPE